VIPDSGKVHIMIGVGDTRKGIDGLQHLVAGHLQRNILSDGEDVFRRRQMAQIKAFCRDRARIPPVSEVPQEG
jgi:hypothetical protein